MSLRRDLRQLRVWGSLAVTLTVVFGTLLWPWLGLAVPLLVAVAVAMNFVRPKWFCRSACPRAVLLTGFLTRWSRFRPSPAWLSSPALRMPFCGLLMVSSLGQLARYWAHWETLGWFFWAICVGTLLVAVPLGLLYKPRSWCASCPVGTLQSTLSRA